VRAESFLQSDPPTYTSDIQIPAVKQGYAFKPGCTTRQLEREDRDEKVQLKKEEEDENSFIHSFIL
jgi:hypothetical protein